MDGGKISAEYQNDVLARARQEQQRPGQEEPAAAGPARSWSRESCPHCGYARADVDPEGILWCPACGYSKKGRYT